MEIRIEDVRSLLRVEVPEQTIRINAAPLCFMPASFGRWSHEEVR